MPENERCGSGISGNQSAVSRRDGVAVISDFVEVRSWVERESDTSFSAW